MQDVAKQAIVAAGEEVKAMNAAMDREVTAEKTGAGGEALPGGALETAVETLGAVVASAAEALTAEAANEAEITEVILDTASEAVEQAEEHAEAANAVRDPRSSAGTNTYHIKPSAFSIVSLVMLERCSCCAPKGATEFNGARHYPVGAHVN
jgi:hypothetical protein